MIYTSGQRLFEKFTRLWFIEASAYNFSVNLSMGFVNAFAIKLLGYGLFELGLLTVMRTAAIVVSQLPATLLLLVYREKRKNIWLIAGAANRILWALVPLALLMPSQLGLVYLASLVFIAQFAGGVASVAAMDCVGANVLSGTAVYVFSKANKLSYLATALSQLAGFAVFLVNMDPLTGYVLVYSLALSFAIVSTALLYMIPDATKATTNGRPAVEWGSVKGVVVDAKLRRYLFVISLFNFSVNIPAPFWDYLVLGLAGGKELLIPVKNVVNLAVKYAAVDWWQRLARKVGIRKALLEGMAFTSLVPVLYLGASSATDVIVAEAVSGVVWAPVDVGTNVYNVYLPPDSSRPIYLSTINLLVNGLSAAAATVGTTMAAWTGSVYTGLVASAALRVLTAGIAYKMLPELDERKPWART